MSSEAAGPTPRPDPSVLGPPEPGWSNAAPIVILHSISVLATPDLQAALPGAELDRAMGADHGSREAKILTAGPVAWLAKG
jgi:hypothetical protein